ncbi:MAG: HD domain-containing protein [Syntrophales bacterium]|nr:HD domain-containing protein [Syntrophales bacterium]
MNASGMIIARKTQLYYYRNVPLYIKTDEGSFILYKPEGVTISDMRVEEGRLPEPLFMREKDKINGLQEAQEAFNHDLTVSVKERNSEKIKRTVVSIVEETLSEPRSGGLEGLSDTVGILISDYSREADVIKHLINLSCSDYSTTLHSINVMALSIRFAYFVRLPKEETKTLGLAALLHDTGKSVIRSEILKAPRRLTDLEFLEMQRHTISGHDILRTCRFNDNRIALSALEHHEKLDGSGYPSGKKNIDRQSRIIALIDCYEAITNDERPYRSSMDPLQALYLMKDDVEKGKYDRDTFETFAYSLTRDA